MGPCEFSPFHVGMCISPGLVHILFGQPYCWDIMDKTSLSFLRDRISQQTPWSSCFPNIPTHSSVMSHASQGHELCYRTIHGSRVPHDHFLKIYSCTGTWNWVIGLGGLTTEPCGPSWLLLPRTEISSVYHHTQLFIGVWVIWHQSSCLCRTHFIGRVTSQSAYVCFHHLHLHESKH